MAPRAWPMVPGVADGPGRRRCSARAALASADERRRPWRAAAALASGGGPGERRWAPASGGGLTSVRRSVAAKVGQHDPTLGSFAG
jgi:hypothetical protein